MHRLNRLLVIAAVAVAALVIATVGIAVASGGKAPRKVTVRTTGTASMKPNKQDPPNYQLVDNLRFKRGTITIRSGGTVTWVSADRSGEPHTITLAKRSQLPRTLDGPCKPCEIASGHLVDPNNPDAGIKEPVLNAGKPGLDTVGDSLVLGPKQKVSAVISAKAGSTLYYICAVHPWMRGKIIVK